MPSVYTTPTQALTIVQPDGDEATQLEALRPWVTLANTMLDARSATCPGLCDLGDEVLSLVAAYLAAHFYALSPGVVSGKLTSDQVGDGVARAYAAPRPKLGLGLVTTPYGQAALGLDTSGCLAQAMAEAEQPKARARVYHLGGYRGE